MGTGNWTIVFKWNSIWNTQRQKYRRTNGNQRANYCIGPMAFAGHGIGRTATGQLGNSNAQKESNALRFHYLHTLQEGYHTVCAFRYDCSTVHSAYIHTDEAMKTACNVEEKFNVVPRFAQFSTNSHKLYKFAQIATAQCSVVCPRHKIPAMLS